MTVESVDAIDGLIKFFGDVPENLESPILFYASTRALRVAKTSRPFRPCSVCHR